MMIFKSLNRLAPVYFHELFSARHTDYDFRYSFRKFNLPKSRTNNLKRSFSYSGALVWNSLPECIRAIRSIGQLNIRVPLGNLVNQFFYSYFNFCKWL